MIVNQAHSIILEGNGAVIGVIYIVHISKPGR